MRGALVITVLVASCAIARVGSAQDRNAFVEGFGGMRLSTVPAPVPSFGATVGGGLTPNIQAIGEFGRVGDVLPGVASSLLAFTPVDFHVSAFYGEGGVRFITDPRAPVRGYVDTLAGIARLNSSFGGIGSATDDALVNIGLRFLNTTDPVASVGGGVIFGGGPLMIDVGYRFRRIFANDAFAGLITGGNLDVNEVHIGVGIRF